MSKDFEIHQFPVEDVQDHSLIAWAVIVARHLNKWVFVKHKKRLTFEAPGGKREVNESIIGCARRELYEETGAIEYEMTPLETYSIKHENGLVSYGQLFYANISKFGDLPESEIGEVKLFHELPNKLTYPYVHSALFHRALEYSQSSTASNNSF